MHLVTHKQFNKAYAKAPKIVKEHFKERRNLFLINPFHPLLNNHSLTGQYVGCRSINITGDWRVIYHAQSGDTIVFLKIGTHSQLYGK